VTNFDSDPCRAVLYQNVVVLATEYARNTSHLNGRNPHILGAENVMGVKTMVDIFQNSYARNVKKQTVKCLVRIVALHAAETSTMLA